MKAVCELEHHEAPTLADRVLDRAQTSPLAEPLVLLGELEVSVDLATTAKDTDVAVRLVDVDPSGDATLLAAGIQRLVARDGHRKYAETAPNTRYSVVVQFIEDLAYTVPAGHSLGVILSASNWPLFSRNPSDAAVFVEGDTAPGTKGAATFGFPKQTVLLTSPGEKATNTIFLDGNTALTVHVAP